MRPEIRRNIASLVEVDVFMYFTIIVHSEQKEGFEQSPLINISPQNRTKKTKTNNERSDVYPPPPHQPRKVRHLVEEREEKWRFFREERKAV